MRHSTQILITNPILKDCKTIRTNLDISADRVLQYAHDQKLIDLMSGADTLVTVTHLFGEKQTALLVNKYIIVDGTLTLKLDL